MADFNDRYNDENRWAGEADYGQRRDRYRGYREDRFAEERHYGAPENRSYDDDHRSRRQSHPLRRAQLNQDIGYGSGSLANGGYASTRAPGSFSDYGAGASGGYGDGYGAYNTSGDQRGLEDRAGYQERGYRSRGYEGDRSYRGYSAEDRYDNRFGGSSGPLATDDILDDITDGKDRGGLFGKHRGRGPKDYKRSDERIKDDVNDRLTDDAWLDAQDITVKVKDREVTLDGHVRSREDKRRAETLAERVSGVDHVQNNLRVKRDDQSDVAELTPLPMV